MRSLSYTYLISMGEFAIDSSSMGLSIGIVNPLWVRLLIEFAIQMAHQLYWCDFRLEPKKTERYPEN